MRIYMCPSCHTRQEASDDLRCPDCNADLGALDNNEEFIIDPDGVLLAYHGQSESITIPDTVREISNSCFDSCTFLKNVVIGDSVECIGICAFLNCSSLTDVSFGKGLTFIGHSAFCGCRLDKVFIPSGVNTLSEYSFYNIHELKHIVIEEGCECICDEAFLLEGDEKNLNRTIHLSSTIKSLGLRVFYNPCGTNHVFTTDSELVKDYFKYDDHPIVLHFIPRPDQYEQAIANVIAEEKRLDFSMINIYEQDVNAKQADLKSIEDRILYLNSKLKQHELDLASASGIFKASKVKKCNNDIAFTKKWLAECNAKADEIKTAINTLQESIARYTHTDCYYRNYAEEKLLNGRAIKYGNVLGGGYPSISLEEYRDAIKRSERDFKNPADDYIVIPVPDITDI